MWIVAMSLTSFRSAVRWAVGSRLFIFLFVAVAFTITSGGHLRQSPDAVFYLGMATAAGRGQVAPFVTSTQANFTILVFPAVLAFARTVSPNHWESIMLAINILSSAIAGVLLVDLVRRVTACVTAAAIALLFYVLSYDIFSWVWYLLTDAIYGCFAVLVFALVIRRIIERDEPGRPARWKVYLATILAAVTRPVGFFVIPLVLAAEWFYAGREPRRSRPLWIVFGSGVVLAFVLHAWFFQDFRRWPVDFMRPKLEYYAWREKKGEVVFDRPETSRRPPVTMTDHLALEVDRFVRFFQVTTSGNSRRHNLMALAYYIPLYGLALAGVIAGLRAGDRTRRAVVEVSLLWILSMAALSGATVLDYDWRYRMALMPQLILLASCGADALLRRVATPAPQEQPL